jgi:hypothetical protein
LQTSPAPQLAPFRLVQRVVLVPGWQIWQEFATFVDPAAWNAPAI